MNYTLIPLPKSEIEIRVVIPCAEFAPHVTRAAILISEEVAIEGFRKGKAPYDVVKNRIGENAIYERAAELAVRKTYPEILRELVTNNQLSATNPPIGQPDITVTKLAPGDDLEYKARTALLPSVALPDYKKIAEQIDGGQKPIDVSDQEVAETLQWIRESRASLLAVARAAAIGDRVEVDLEIRHGGVAIEGGDSKNHPVILGKGKFLPGLEDALAGMKSGEEKTLTIAVPENWRDKTYAGKTLEIKAAMKLVQERKIPELTDEFAQRLGNFASAEALKKNVHEGILREKEVKERERIRTRIIEEIAREARIDVPDILVERESDTMLNELKHGIEGMGLEWNQYLAHINKSAEALRQEWNDEALRRVRAALCLNEIARLEHIELSDDEVKKEMDAYLNQRKNAAETKSVLDQNHLKKYTQGIVRNEKVLQFLEHAQKQHHDT